MDIQHDGKDLETDIFDTNTDPTKQGIITKFREKISGNLKYGAAYFPNVLSDFNYNWKVVKVKRDGTEIPFGPMSSLEKSAIKLAVNNFKLTALCYYRL